MAPSAITPVTAPVLDHVGFIVAELAAVRGLLDALGLRYTLRADHTRSNAGGELVSAGSSQHAVMLHNGYIEFMQITDVQAGHQLSPAVGVRFGLHVLALGTRDAQACRVDLARKGVAVGPLLNWARQVSEGDTVGLAKFCYFDSRWDPHDPSYICWVQHLTPELLRPPQLLCHENGALGLTGIVYRGPRAAARSWSEQLLAAGASLAAQQAGGLVLSLGNASIGIEFDEAMSAVLPVALELAFSDCADVRARCAALGVSVRDLGAGAFELDLARQLGLDWICRPAVN